MNAITAAIEHWDYVAPLLKEPKNEREYNKLVASLDELLDAGASDEESNLATLADRVGDLISAYESRHHTIETTGIDALKLLMEQNNLSQSDLSGIGSQGVISELLNGKRELNIRQIRTLAQRFNVSPIVFMG